MSKQIELGPGESISWGTASFGGETLVFVQNLDHQYVAQARIKPVGSEITDLSRRIFGGSFYESWEGDIKPLDILKQRFKYAGAIMELTNIGHTRLKAWTDI